ncbi:MAG: hypothetical protein SF029_00255 [bacterium]|nr:hypothetical protein [bacterium]
MAENTSQVRSPRTRRPSTRRHMPSDHTGVLIAGGMMMVVGWAGLYWLITTQKVGLGPEIWLFFVLLHMAIVGTVLPLVRYLNARLTPLEREPASGGVIVRQSVWVGLFVVICAWLQIPRVLTLPMAFFLALVFVVIEAFLRLREANFEED